MTPRNMLAVDFKEVGAVEVRCKCGAVTSVPLPRSFNIDHFTCIGCNSMLWYGEMEGTPYKKVKALIEAISAWQYVEGANFTLGFSVEALAPVSRAKD